MKQVGFEGARQECPAQMTMVIHVLLKGDPHQCIFCFIVATPGTKHIIDVAFVKGKALGMLGEHLFTFMGGEAKVSVHGGWRASHCSTNKLFPVGVIKLEQCVSQVSCHPEQRLSHESQTTSR
jgi:hypothetical protein